MPLPGAVVVAVVLLLMTETESMIDTHANALYLSLEQCFPALGFHFIQSLMEMPNGRVMPSHLSQLLT